MWEFDHDARHMLPPLVVGEFLKLRKVLVAFLTWVSPSSDIQHRDHFSEGFSLFEECH